MHRIEFDNSQASLFVLVPSQNPGGSWMSNVQPCSIRSQSGQLVVIQQMWSYFCVYLVFVVFTCCHFSLAFILFQLFSFFLSIKGLHGETLGKGEKGVCLCQLQHGCHKLQHAARVFHVDSSVAACQTLHPA